jgi:hypothetical protein
MKDEAKVWEAEHLKEEAQRAQDGGGDCEGLAAVLEGTFGASPGHEYTWI